MGVLPLEFTAGQDATSLGLSGKEIYSIGGIAAGVKPAQVLTVEAVGEDGKTKTFHVKLRIDTPNEVDYYRHGGILHYVLRQLAGAVKA